jgi:CRISPR/Cas system-associated exonuclease Cas4 (RecB family)
MISEILARARRASQDRDPLRPAVSDLFGCDRSTWYRRNGYKQPEVDDGTLRKFDLGHAIEGQIVSRLREAGAHVRTGFVIALRVQDGTLIARRIESDDEPDQDEISGHPDALVARADGGTLLEVKSSDVRKIEPTCKPHYALQAAAYALGTHAKRCIVHLTHTALYLKDEKEYEIDHEALRGRVTERVVQVLERTAPGAPIPPAIPERESAAYACKYCPWAQCVANPAYVEDEIPA